LVRTTFLSVSESKSEYKNNPKFDFARRFSASSLTDLDDSFTMARKQSGSDGRTAVPCESLVERKK